MQLMPFRTNPFSKMGRNLERDFFGSQSNMNDVLDNFFGRSMASTPQLYDMNIYPAIDVKDKEDKYQLEAELPGLEENDVQLDLHNNVLTITGQKNSESKTETEDFMHAERYFGAFRRDIPFEEEVDPDNVKAVLKKGILHIELTKREGRKKSHKKIEIKH